MLLFCTFIAAVVSVSLMSSISLRRLAIVCNSPPPSLYLSDFPSSFGIEGVPSSRIRSINTFFMSGFFWEKRRKRWGIEFEKSWFPGVRVATTAPRVIRRRLEYPEDDARGNTLRTRVSIYLWRREREGERAIISMALGTRLRAKRDDETIPTNSIDGSYEKWSG